MSPSDTKCTTSNAVPLLQQRKAHLLLQPWIEAVLKRIDAEESAAALNVSRAYRVMVSNGCHLGWKDWKEWKDWKKGRQDK